MTNRLAKIITVIILFSGVLLTVVQFFYNRTLCGDEVWLALNIVNRNSFELFQPLDYVQSAPVLFLQIEKIFSSIFSDTELGLKIFPLISYLASLFLFFKILRIIHEEDYVTIVFSLALFVFNIYLIRYSNEVKQYMTDVLVATYIYYLVLRVFKKTRHKYFHLCIAGIVSVFLSNVSIAVLFTVGLYLLYNNYRYKTKQFLHVIFISITWGISFVIYYLLFVRNNPVKNEMVSMWTNDFMPLNPLSYGFYEFIFYKVTNILLDFFQFGNQGWWLIIFVITGLYILIKKKRIDLLILLLIPVIIQFILSGFKVYPLISRVLLYLCPLIIIICSFGYDFMVTKFSEYSRIKIVKPLLIFIPVIMICYFGFLVYVNSYPVTRSELKNSIKNIEANIEQNDTVYITCFASWAYQYYEGISFMEIKNTTIVGTARYKNDLVSYHHELDALHGRVWFLFTGIGDKNNENKNTVINYFDLKGEVPLNNFHTIDSDVYLYDL